MLAVERGVRNWLGLAYAGPELHQEKMMQDSPVRWLHLSDFHVGKDNYAQRRLFEKILDHVREQVDLHGAPDLVFVTGDLAQQGKPEEFTMFYEEFLFPLVEDALGAGWKGKVFTIPGNHDVQRGRNAYFDRAKICEPESRFFDPTEEGLQMRQIVLPRFDAYREDEKRALEAGLTHSPANWLGSFLGAFHHRMELRGHPIGVVGVNTAWLSMDAADKNRLSPGFHLLEAALDSVKDCEARIVLGHHPLDWMHEDQMEGLRALLGKHGALYLHGHLHRTRAHQEEGAGNRYLAIQAGAGFQARNDEKWRNGLLWAELYLLSMELRLQPRSWNHDQQDWPLEAAAFPEKRRKPGSDWWVYPLPGTRKERQGMGPTSRPGSVPTPKGWQVVDRLFLDSHRRALSKEDALLYFDGSVPSWRLALAAEEIPRRRVVGQMMAKLNDGSDSSPRVLLLVGPGGEGKSTAVLQTIVALLEQDEQLRVLWREDESRSLSSTDVRALPRSVRWLIATDDADLMAKELFDIAKALHAAGRGDVGLLLTCRDTDWLAAGGDDFPWRSHSHFDRVELSDLNADDARGIVTAWARQGAQGLGRLAGKSEEEAARLLTEAATREAAQKERGAFFGAILEVRLGEALREHLKALLDRLKEREIHSGVTLLDAFGYVAAMHAEGLTFLSRPVLAKALECDPSQLKAKVLAPLGREAAAIGAGQFILTRHRTIARVAVELLSEVLQWEVDDLFVDLVCAAKAASSETFIPPDLKSWEFSLPDYFLEARRPDLAIRIGRAVLDSNPDDYKKRSNLAKLYREVGAPEEASRLFRGYEGELGRGAYYEWGTVEGAAGNAIGGAWLAALSLADQGGGPPPSSRDAKLGLAGLGVAFGNLFECYNDPVFREARAAVGVLGLTLQLDATARGYFQKYMREARTQGAPEMTGESALDCFEAGVRAIGELCDAADPLAARLPLPGQLTFERLRRLLGHAAQR